MAVRAGLKLLKCRVFGCSVITGLRRLCVCVVGVGNQSQSSALVSTCQSLGQLCRPCDDTYPLTPGSHKGDKEQEVFLMGEGWSLLPGLVKSVKVWRHRPSSAVFSNSVRKTLNLIGKGFFLSRIRLWVFVTRVSWECDTSVQVGAVTFDLSRKNDLNLHGHRVWSCSLKWSASQEAQHCFEMCWKTVNLH